MLFACSHVTLDFSYVLLVDGHHICPHACIDLYTHVLAFFHWVNVVATPRK